MIQSLQLYRAGCSNPLGSYRAAATDIQKLLSAQSLTLNLTEISSLCSTGQCPFSQNFWKISLAGYIALSVRRRLWVYQLQTFVCEYRDPFKCLITHRSIGRTPPPPTMHSVCIPGSTSTHAIYISKWDTFAQTHIVTIWHFWFLSYPPIGFQSIWAKPTCYLHWDKAVNASVDACWTTESEYFCIFLPLN